MHLAMPVGVRRVDSERVEYVVELSPRMWARVGAISRSSFEKLRERAKALAGLVGETRFLDEGSAASSEKLPRNAFDLDGAWALYEVDQQRRSLVVIDITDTPTPELHE